MYREHELLQVQLISQSFEIKFFAFCFPPRRSWILSEISGLQVVHHLKEAEKAVNSSCAAGLPQSHLKEKSPM